MKKSADKSESKKSVRTNVRAGEMGVMKQAYAEVAKTAGYSDDFANQYGSQSANAGYGG